MSHLALPVRQPDMNTFDNIVHRVTDLAAAKAFHTAVLDTEPHTDQPYYVGFNVAGFEIGLAPTQPDEAPSSVPHVRVPDIEAAIQSALEAGGTLVSEPRDVGAGNRVASVSAPGGTVIGLIQRAS